MNMSVWQRQIFRCQIQTIVCHCVVLFIDIFAYEMYHSNFLSNSCNHLNEWWFRSLTHQYIRFMGVNITVSKVRIRSKKLLYLSYWGCYILMTKHQRISQGTKMESTYYSDVSNHRQIDCWFINLFTVGKCTVSLTRYCILFNNPNSHQTADRLVLTCRQMVSIDLRRN